MGKPQTGPTPPHPPHRVITVGTRPQLTLGPPHPRHRPLAPPKQGHKPTPPQAHTRHLKCRRTGGGSGRGCRGTWTGSSPWRPRGLPPLRSRLRGGARPGSHCAEKETRAAWGEAWQGPWISTACWLSPGGVLGGSSCTCSACLPALPGAGVPTGDGRGDTDTPGRGGLSGPTQRLRDAATAAGWPGRQAAPRPPRGAAPLSGAAAQGCPGRANGCDLRVRTGPGEHPGPVRAWPVRRRAGRGLTL